GLLGGGLLHRRLCSGRGFRSGGLSGNRRSLRSGHRHGLGFATEGVTDFGQENFFLCWSWWFSGRSRGLSIPNRIDALHDKEQHEGNNGELYNRIDEQTDIKRGDASLL